ncbi:MAG: DUF104 domain-containing protein [Acidimicrobiia bacterium]|nr:antitoxin family protein [bacterium]MXX00754.1 DUF104 domain-containing protein [Acidimicrobiia bacterium]MDE0675332.1 antitoxin family protein [bacterium]MXX45431.1 DUF104 domain-containing protein [Acidimicrobiia bacterium]MXY73335.1 DUF104 domain-containing protein [Acidimicrobiia bacterium]
MAATVKATYINGVFMPVDPVDLEEGAEVMVSMGNASPPVGLSAIVKAVKELHETVPPDSWDVLPTDLAKNKKHYLYRHPRVDSG